MRKTARFRPGSRRLSFCLGVLLALGVAGSAGATDFTWTGGGSGNGWDDPFNWQGKIPPFSAPDTFLIFGTATASQYTATASTAYTLGGIRFEGANQFNLRGGTLTLSNAAGGIVQNSSATQVIQNKVVLGADQTWSFGGAGLLFLPSGVDNGGHALTLSSTTTAALSTSISGSGGLTVTTTNNGYVNLTQANTYTGETMIAGTLNILGSLGSTSVNVKAGGVLSVEGNGAISAASGNTLIVDGTVSLTGKISTGNTYVGNNGSGTFNQSGGSFTTNGSPLLLGNSAGSSGTFNLSGTGSSLSTGSAFVGNLGSGTFNQSGGSFSTGILLLGSSGTYTLAGGTLMAGNVAGGAGTSTFHFAGGTLQANASTTSFFSGLTTADVQAGGAKIDTQGYNVTIGQGLLSGVTNGIDGGLTKLGSGTLTLTNKNVYTGPTTVSAGTLQAGVGTGAFGNLSALTLANAAGATLDLNNFDETLGSLVGGGASGGNVTLGTGTLTVGGNSVSTTYAGSISGGGGLTKTGAGTLTLTGANTYTGATTISAGTLQVGSGGTTGTLGTNQARITNNGTLAFNRTDDLTLANVVSGSGALTKLGAGTLTLTGNNAYTGTTTISAGTLQVGSGGTTGTLGAGAVVNNARLDFNRTDSFAVANSSSGAGGLTQSGSGTLTLTGANTYTGTTTISAGTLQVGDGGSLGATNISVGVGAAFNVTGTGTLPATDAGGTSSSSNLTLYGTASLSGTGTLYRGTVTVGESGVGSLTQNSGSLIVNQGGRLFLGNNAGSSGTYNLSGAGSNLSTGVVIVGASGNGTFNQSGGSFTINGINPLTLGNNAGSSGTYNLSGAGSSLSTGNTYVGYFGGGTFNQSGGSFTINDVGLLLSYGPNSSGTYTLAGGTLTAGSVRSGAGTSTFHFAGGTLRASASTASFFSGLTTADVQAGGAKIDTQGYNVTIGQRLVHDTTSSAPAIDGGLTKLGSGTLTLTGANTYTGTTTISAGTLQVGDGGSLGATNISVGAGAAFNVTGTGTLPATDAGGLSSNTLTLDGTAAAPATATFSGTGTLYRGTVIVGQSGVGSLTQNSGSLIVSPIGRIELGSKSNSSGTYNLSGTGSLQNAGDVYVGNLGSGTFNQSGGSFSTNGLLLGYRAGSGTYNLSGAGSSLSTGTAYVGFSGSGTFNQSGGSFSTNSLVLGRNGSSSGTYTLAGGTLTTGNVAGGAGTSTFHFAGGTLQANASTTSFFSGLTTADVQAGGAKIDTQGYNVTIGQGLLSGVTNGIDGGLTKLGSGTLTLTGASTYTGPTQVSAGTLAVSGSLQGTGTLTVADKAVLAGTGSIAGAVQVQAGGTFAPGQLGVGQLTLGNNLTLQGTATAAFTLAGTVGISSTQALVAGQIDLGTSATLSLSLASGYMPAVGDKFFLLDDTSLAPVLGTFANAPLTGSLLTVGGVTFQVNYADSDPNDPRHTLLNDLSVTVIAVPEPSVWALVAAGLGLLGIVTLRQPRRAWLT